VKNLDTVAEHVPAVLSSEIPDLRDKPLEPDDADVAIADALIRVVDQTGQPLVVAAFSSSI
jgi:hypothetical protein